MTLSPVVLLSLLCYWSTFGPLLGSSLLGGCQKAWKGNIGASNVWDPWVPVDSQCFARCPKSMACLLARVFGADDIPIAA